MNILFLVPWVPVSAAKAASMRRMMSGGGGGDARIIDVISFGGDGLKGAVDEASELTKSGTSVKFDEIHLFSCVLRDHMEQIIGLTDNAVHVHLNMGEEVENDTFGPIDPARVVIHADHEFSRDAPGFELIRGLGVADAMAVDYDGIALSRGFQMLEGHDSFAKADALLDSGDGNISDEVITRMIANGTKQIGNLKGMINQRVDMGIQLGKLFWMTGDAAVAETSIAGLGVSKYGMVVVYHHNFKARKTIYHIRCDLGRSAPLDAQMVASAIRRAFVNAYDYSDDDMKAVPRGGGTKTVADGSLPRIVQLHNLAIDL